MRQTSNDQPFRPALLIYSQEGAIHTKGLLTAAIQIPPSGVIGGCCGSGGPEDSGRRVGRYCSSGARSLADVSSISESTPP